MRRIIWSWIQTAYSTDIKAIGTHDKDPYSKACFLNIQISRSFKKSCATILCVADTSVRTSNPCYWKVASRSSDSSEAVQAAIAEARADPYSVDRSGDDCYAAHDGERKLDKFRTHLVAHFSLPPLNHNALNVSCLQSRASTINKSEKVRSGMYTLHIKIDAGDHFPLAHHFFSVHTTVCWHKS